MLVPLQDGFAEAGHLPFANRRQFGSAECRKDNSISSDLGCGCKRMVGDHLQHEVLLSRQRGVHGEPNE